MVVARPVEGGRVATRGTPRASKAKILHQSLGRTVLVVRSHIKITMKSQNSFLKNPLSRLLLIVLEKIKDCLVLDINIFILKAS